MKKIETGLKGAFIIEPQVFGDNRGWFMETYNEDKFRKLGIDTTFIQDNHSFSAQKGTLRGLHFQKNPYPQAKLLHCIRGKILDIAIDLRVGSPQYLKWTSVKLSGENKLMFYIPRGFAHGFLTLTEDVEVQYKVDNLYSAESDMSIAWDDRDIGVDWGINNPILSAKDINAQPIGERKFFTYGDEI